jgi:anti-sigma regulatory factor (Ser/Thr protein kinase)
VNTETEQEDIELVTSLHTVVQPAGVPVLPLVDLDGAFCVPSDASEPTGTWFDVVVLPDDRVALVVGEVPGIGLTAAVTAAQVRAVIRAGLRRDVSVVEALQLADVHAEDAPEARGTSALVVLVDPDRASITYATAGHPPPLLLAAHGPVQPLSDTGGGLLGTGTGTGFGPTTCPLAPGDVVLLASAVAQRSAPLEVPTDAEGGASGAFDDLERVVEAVLPGMASDGTLALVAARLRDSPQRELVVRWPRDAGPVRRAREELSDWLAELRASAMDQMSIIHAAAELVTNAVEHGGSHDDGQVELHARLGSDGVVRVEVLDRGSWQEPSEDLERGRGLAMAAGLVDHLGVSVGPFGTRALLQHRLTRPVSIDASRPAGSGASPHQMQVAHPSPHVVAVRGDFGHDDVDRVAAEMLVASRGGTIGLSLDLTDVSELSTSAIRLLVDLTSVNRAVGMFTADIDVSASAGSTTQRALEIAGVPHRAV